MAVSTDLIRYVGGLVLAGGDHDGARFRVLPWERRFLRGVWARHRSGDAGLSIARGNGKSALLAAVAAAVVDPRGPLHGRRRETVVVASSFDQAKIIFEDVLAFLSDRYDLGDRSLWRRQDSANRATLEYRRSGARIRCLGSDPGRLHGIRPMLALCDEPAQWPTAKADRMRAALSTSLGKVPGSRLIALGTRPATADHWFSRLLKAAEYSQVHMAKPGADPFSMRSIRAANPSWDHLPSLRARIMRERDEARVDPDALASFRALRLNGGTSDVDRAVLLDADAWRRAMDAAPADREPPYVLGLDLGTSAAMSAAAAYFHSGHVDAVAVLPEQPTLRAKGVADGVGRLYEKMFEAGELVISGARVANIRRLLTESLARWGIPAAVVCDRWREAELRQTLEAVGFPVTALEVRGMGYKDGGEDVRQFRAAVLGDRVIAPRSLLLASALAEARVTMDPAGNSKLAKNSAGGRRVNARDDAAAAAILAVAAGYRAWHTGAVRRRGTYLGIV